MKILVLTVKKKFNFFPRHVNKIYKKNMFWKRGKMIEKKNIWCFWGLKFNTWTILTQSFIREKTLRGRIVHVLKKEIQKNSSMKRHITFTLGDFALLEHSGGKEKQRIFKRNVTDFTQQYISKFKVSNI